MIQTTRVYDPPSASDGARFLVDRLWPRGMKKEALKMDAWLKDVAPSDELFEKTASNLEEASARGGRVILISDRAGIARLGKRVAQCIVDLYLGQPQARRAVAVHDQIGLEAARLQIRIDIGDFRNVLQSRAKFLRPGAQFAQIIAEQSVLILRVRSASAAAAVFRPSYHLPSTCRRPLARSAFRSTRATSFSPSRNGRT